jgi:hypothetical protein
MHSSTSMLRPRAVGPLALSGKQPVRLGNGGNSCSASGCIGVQFAKSVKCRGKNAATSRTSLRRVVCQAVENERAGEVEKKQEKGEGSVLSWVSPDWLTGLVQLVKGKDDSGIPTADAKLEDVQDLLGGALFLPLFKWMKESGPIYRLAAGPRNFVIVSDPAMAKHVLRAYGTTYAKGLVAEVAVFLFGSGFAIAEGQLWTVRIAS